MSNESGDHHAYAGASSSRSENPSRYAKPNSTVTISDEPLNLKLKKKHDFTGLVLKPRSYQTELANELLKGNRVIYLGTGLGKTFIVVLFLNHPYIDEKIQNGKKVVFLATTQDLIKQQAVYINRQVRYRVKIFCGRSGHCGEHIDHWNKQIWDLELKGIDVLFMTPQIFFAAISTGHLSWTDFAAIIFDEVHHALKTKKKTKAGSPYYQILQSYKSYYSIRPHESLYPRPRLIGLTASLINNMPKNRDSIIAEIVQLEESMLAKCITNLEVQEKKPQLIIHTFTSSKVTALSDLLVKILTNCINSLDVALKRHSLITGAILANKHISSREKKEFAFLNRLRLAAAGYSIKPMSFTKVLGGLIKIRERCGLWMMCAITHKLIGALNNHKNNPYFSKDMSKLYEDFTEILTLIYKTFYSLLPNLPDFGLLAYTRPKPKVLLEILESEYERTMDGSNGKSSFSCIIFVTSRLEVVALNIWLQAISSTIPKYGFIKSDYAIGLAATQASKYSCITKRKSAEQYKMLSDFREGILNTIVTTSVLEEGIDLPVCSTVICHNSPTNFRAYVQSRGRARQNISTFVIMCEQEDYDNEIDKMDKFSDFEQVVRDKLGKNDIAAIARPTIATKEVRLEDEEDFFFNEDKSMRITPSIAKTILHMYCHRLAQRTPFTDGVRYDMTSPAHELYQATLFLPSNCPVKEGIKGKLKSSTLLASNSAIIAAVKELLDAGELNQYGAPKKQTEANIDELLESKNLAPKFDKLDADLEGLVVKEGDREVFLYEPALRRSVGDPLTKNYEDRAYKIMALKFASSGGRQETEEFFEKPVFGLIVDSTASNEFIPPLVHSHYGQFTVMSREVSNNLRIRRMQEHEVYLKYTLRLLKDCLGFNRLEKTGFHEHCHFYVVPLKDDAPDTVKMNQSFRRREFKTYDIVKESVLYKQNKEKYRQSNFAGLMLVKAVHRNMDGNSVIPGTRNFTFVQAAEEKLGLKPNPNQPIIEVMPISKDLGSSKHAKRYDRNHQTTSRFYMEEFLDLFDDEPYYVFQSTLLPFIIDRLYKNSMATNLDRKFCKDTQDKRDQTIVAKIADKLLEFGIQSPCAMDEPPNDGDIEMEIEPDGGEEEEELNVDSESNQSEDSENEEDDDAYYVTEDNIMLADTDDEEDELIVGSDYSEMINKRSLTLEEDDDTDHLKPWNMSEYKVPNLQRQKFEHAHTPGEQETASISDASFQALAYNVDRKMDSLLDNIGAFFERLTSDQAFLDESAEFQKRTAKVDSTIAAPIKFDRNVEPIRNGTRERALIEALTQRSAGETYNLEGLENIGDSYLKYVTSVVLFKSLEGNEGFLSSARSRLTCNKYFCHLAKKNRLGSYAITKSFSKDMLAYMMGVTNRDFSDLHNRMRPKALADLFESIVGGYLVYCSEYEATLAMEWLGLDIFNPNLFTERHEQAVVFSKVSSALTASSSAEGSADEISVLFYKSCAKKMSKFEEILGYKFNDPSFLIQAFTHASSNYKCTRSYERLEFLGDAILDLLVTMTLVKTTRMDDPGQITSSRSALVNNVAFAKLSIKYKFDLFIQYCCQDIYDELTNVRLAMEEDPTMSFLDMINFDRIVKLLADVFESVAGAIYLDSGLSLDTVWGVYYPMMKEAIDYEIKNPSKNLIASLFETFPGRGRISFDRTEVTNDDGTPVVSVRCRIFCHDEKSEYRDFEARGITKNQARQRAAELALKDAPTGQDKIRLCKLYQKSQKKDEGPTSNTRGSREGKGGHRYGLRSGNYNHRGQYRTSRPH